MSSSRLCVHTRQRCFQKAFPPPPSITRMDFLFQLLVDAINPGMCVCACVCVCVHTHARVHVWVPVGRTAPHSLVAGSVALNQLKRCLGEKDETYNWCQHWAQASSAPICSSRTWSRGARLPGLLLPGCSEPIRQLTTDVSESLSACTPRTGPLNVREQAQQRAHRFEVQETSNDVQKKLSRLRIFPCLCFILGLSGGGDL